MRFSLESFKPRVSPLSGRSKVMIIPSHRIHNASNLVAFHFYWYSTPLCRLMVQTQIGAIEMGLAVSVLLHIDLQAQMCLNAIERHETRS